MEYTLNQIQSIIGGRIFGEGETVISGIASIEYAEKGDVTFIKNDALIPKALSSLASALVVHREIPELKKPYIVIKNPFYAFTLLMEDVAKKRFARPANIHHSAIISNNTTIGKGASIGAYVVIEDNVVIGNDVVIYPHTFIGKDCKIGDNALIYANVSIREKCSIGKNVIIHCNSVIGDDGFGYLQIEKKHVKIPQIGTVEIGNDVEIGSMVTICRAAIDKTIIGNGVKIDNHSHVAHNVEIGDNTMLVGYAKIAGSAKIGKNVMIAEDVGVTDHATIGDNCVIGGGSKVYKSLKPGSVVWGAPAKAINEEKRMQVLLRKLPEMYQALKKIMHTS
ncbi:MAG: UDP-3-O-(3-hydroxymyristoyl)glucosamine N-acyltransferase [Candidatus Kuenenia sp.]|nr:UDP-3-O-(3-hydroxymyristoyl)glucosamine N-acyltransferase [Candidatus Kuenenia hertensis]